MGKDQLGEVRGLCEGPICLPPACGPAVLSARAMRLQDGSGHEAAQGELSPQSAGSHLQAAVGTKRCGTLQ